LSHNFNDNNIFKLNLIGAIDKTEVHDFSSESILNTAQNAQEPIMKQNSLTYGATWRRTSKNKNSLLITTVSRSQFSNNFKRFADNVSQNNLLFDHNSSTIKTYLSSNFKRYFRNTTLSVGFKVQKLNYSVKSNSSLLPNFDYENRLSFNRYGFHVGVKGNNEDVNLFYNVGLRSDTDNFLFGSSFFKHVSPRVALKFYLNDKIFLNTSYGLYYRMPPMTALGFKENQISVNKDLKYINSNQIDLGFGYQKNNFEKFSLTSFYKRYNDYPFSISDQVSIANKGVDFDIYGNENLTSSSSGNTYGLEFFYQRQLHKKFYGNISYTLFKSEFTSIGNDFIPSSWDTRHIFSMNYGLKMKKDWEASFRFRYNGQQPFAIADLDKTNISYPIITYNYSSLGHYKLDAFIQGDLRVDKRYNFNKMALNVYVEVLNCFFNSVPIPPQYGLYNLQDAQTVLPILVSANNSPIPTIGLVIDF
jgi:outer membrane receptor for ferrienterochelin and colicin